MIDPAIDIIREAGAVARAVQRDLEDIRQITKDDRSPVTVADFAVQAVVALALRERFGTDVDIVGEEHAGALRSDDQRHVRQSVIEAVRIVRPNASEDDVLDAIDACDHDAEGRSYWTLDPIDGTKGFLRGQQYAIALAHLGGGSVQLAAMGCPNLPADHMGPLDTADEHGTVYAAVAGNGVWEIDGRTPEQRRPIEAARLPGEPSRIRTCESVEKSHSKQSDTQRVLDALGADVDPVRLDSQCKYALVARGQADAYMRLPTSRTYVEKIWDHAAGMLIATEAGAIVTDAAGAPLDFTTGPRLERNRGIICAVPGLHERIIASIDKLEILSAASAG